MRSRPDGEDERRAGSGGGNSAGPASSHALCGAGASSDVGSDAAARFRSGHEERDDVGSGPHRCGRSVLLLHKLYASQATAGPDADRADPAG